MQGKIWEIGPHVDVFHNILGGFGISYVSIAPAVSEKTDTVIKGFSFIVMGDNRIDF